MPRGIPKVKQSQGDEITNTGEENAPNEVTVIKVEPVEEQALKKGDQFLINVDGESRYLTKSVIDVMLRRQTNDIEIPKGSPYTPPANTKCVNCG